MYMALDALLSGRNERRLPIIVVVNLARANGAVPEKSERTYTDNISAHGVRVHSTHPWQLGDHAKIAPVKGEPTMIGEVVYCQRLADDRFFIGLRFAQGGLPWTIFRKYDGIVLRLERDWTFAGSRIGVLA